MISKFYSCDSLKLYPQIPASTSFRRVKVRTQSPGCLAAGALRRRPLRPDVNIYRLGNPKRAGILADLSWDVSREESPGRSSKKPESKRRERRGDSGFNAKRDESRLLLDGFLQVSSGLESWNFTGFDRNRLARLRIAALTRFAAANLKAAKTDQRNLLPLLDRCLDRVKSSVQCFPSFRF